MNVADLRPPAEYPKVREHLEKSYPGFVFETLYMRKDGSVFPVEISTKGAMLDGEKALFGIIRDITERKQAEEDREKVLHRLGERVKELKALHSMARIFQKQSMIPVLLQEMVSILPPAWQYPGVTTARVTYDGNEYRTKNFIEGRWRQIAEFVTSNGKKGAIEIFYIEETPPKAEGPFLTEERNLINSMAEMLHIYLDRKQAEEALHESESRFRQLSESLPQLVWTCLADGMSDYVSPQWVDYTGVPEKSQLGRGWLEQVHPEDDRERVAREWASIAARDAQYDIEYRMRRYDGVYRWFKARATPIHDTAGNLVKWFGSNTDIDDLKRAEKGLRESEEKFRILTETASAAICILQDGKFQYINRATETITGYSSDELIAMDFIRVIHTDSRGYVVGQYSNWLAGLIRQARFETKILCKNGEERYVDISVSTIDYRGRPGLILTAVDITERKRAEEVLIEAKQQAELYVDLMGHDISNMNHSAMGYLELALETLEMEKRLKPDDKLLIERPMRVLEGSSALIDNVRKLQMLMTEGVKTKPTNLNKIFRELEAMSFHSHDREVLINIQPVPGYIVEANELLKDVFVNLITNAIKHSDEEKPLTVSVKVEPVDENGQKYYRCMVEDDGHGIPDELKSKLFHRFHRGATKAHGKGLGLYLVRTLVEGYQGKVWVEDRLQGDHTKGARFVVMLPAVEQ